tara:strand:- start:3463 stop:3825 length:363 start_codon:yes stop_codon:yes gene_type:complete
MVFMNFNVNVPGWGTDMGITWGMNEPEPNQFNTTDYGGIGPFSGGLFSWETTAESIVDVLDPYYGEGGMLEPVTVIVDEDRTIKDEYIDPLIDEYGEQYLAAIETPLLVAGLIALAVIVK